MKDKLKKVKKPVKLLKTKKKKMVDAKKKKIESMSVNEFMNGFMDDGLKKADNKQKKKVLKKSSEEAIKKKFNKVKVQESDLVEEEEKEEESTIESDTESDAGDEYGNHKMHLNSLKKTDPEFYKYLEENDQELLNFEDSDIDSNEKEEEEAVHKPPDELEVASDESDYELDEDIKSKKQKGNRVTKEILEKWQRKLKGRCKIQDLRDVGEAFHSALSNVSSNETYVSTYKVEGAVVFNSVIRMCVTDFLPAIQKILKYKDSKTIISKCKYWNRVKPILKNYLIDLVEFCTATSPNMLRVLLKHIHQLSPFIVCFPIIAQKFLKRVIQLWATDEDVIRVLAFLCTLRLSNLRRSLLKYALKVMHLTYVRNTKFVSPNSLPGINFMRQSLSEMFALDNTISYHMAFLYIRQLAIHLRSAIIQKKKESYKIVYNWAYISSLHLWAELFGIIPNDSPLKSLLYPLVQIIIGTIKLMPSSSFYPLRFHCCKILIQIRKRCDVFIPILPFLLEVLRDYNFTQKHKKLTIKPLDFTCVLRCSKVQMKENGFKDAIIENIYSLLMEYIEAECHRVSFPDIMIPCVIQLKAFLKTCKFANYCKKIKSILDKIAENSKFIETERKKLNLKIDDISGVDAAEAAIRAKEPPFLKYYESWKKIHIQQQAKKLTNDQTLDDLKLPVLNKLGKKTKSKSEGPTELFPSDDDSDEECLFDDEEIEPPRKRKKTEPPSKNINVKKEVESENDEEEQEMGSSDIDSEECGDIVEDLTYSDFK